MKKAEGFTLIEAIVYTAVLFIIVNVIVSFLLWTVQANNKSEAMRETLDSAQEIMTAITYEVRSAESVYWPTTTSTQLSLETLKHIPPGEQDTFVDIYWASSSVLLKREEQDPIVLNSDKVEIKNLNFTVVSETSTFPSIRVSLEAAYKNPGNLPQYTADIEVTSTVSVRSY